MTQANPISKKAICLLSGGLDSATALYVARQEGYEVYGLTVRYGQLHEKEVAAATVIAEGICAGHEVVSLNFPWGGSALLDPGLDVPMGRSREEYSSVIPATYVPARNTVFLSLAASYAEVIGAQAVFIGANAVDYSGYPDCRPHYLTAFEKMIAEGTRAGIEGQRLKIEAPLLRLSKKSIVLLGLSLGVPFRQTWSCYLGQEIPCGSCDACVLRKMGFDEAGVPDPLAQYEPAT